MSEKLEKGTGQLPSDAQFRLQMGELTAHELRVAKAAYRMAVYALTKAFERERASMAQAIHRGPKV